MIINNAPLFIGRHEKDWIVFTFDACNDSFELVAIFKLRNTNINFIQYIHRK